MKISDLVHVCSAQNATVYFSPNEMQFVVQEDESLPRPLEGHERLFLVLRQGMEPLIRLSVRSANDASLWSKGTTGVCLELSAPDSLIPFD